MHTVTGKLISHGHSGRNLRTIGLASNSEFRIQRVLEIESPLVHFGTVPSVVESLLRPVAAYSLFQQRVRSLTLTRQVQELFSGKASIWTPQIEAQDIPEYLVYKHNTIERNSTRLRAGQVASTSSEQRELSCKSEELRPLHGLLNVKAMDMEVKKSDDESSKDSISVLQTEVTSPRQIRGPSPHAKPWQVNSLHPDPRMHSSRRKNE
ncbi:hypothetical protein F5141DRAFT_1063152 [Pisolithus sp. B1]|nr:hypothetical protein F5141DRAFT_1063152 [Pisolithus sp. B1]